MDAPDLVPLLLDISIDPCDGSVAPSLQYVLIRGFSAMGWEQPSAAAEDMAMEILKMIRPGSKPHPMDEGLRRTQETMTIRWLRGLSVEGDRGVVNNIDARSLGRIADDIDRMTALNGKLTEDFNTLALDRSQWQERAEKVETENARLAAENERLLLERDRQITYACDLQRIVEDLCASRPIRVPESAARHHYDMAVAARAALSGGKDGE